MDELIYMDHHATTPVHPEVFEAMKPCLMENFGNPASTTHMVGKLAYEATENAREMVARLINAQPEEIVFTSGATESDNMAVKGAGEALQKSGNHIITCRVEHKAILEACKFMEKKGFNVTYLPVDKYAMVDPADVEKAITDKTILVTIMMANSEVGTIEPIKEIAGVAHNKGVLMHTDAAQAAGKIKVDVHDLGVDLLSLSGHKMYGPKGVGAMYVKKKTKLTPLFHGGGHEKKRRSGTLNVPGIVGLGEACAVAIRDMSQDSERVRKLRDKLYEGITSRIERVYLNGHPEKRLPNNLNLTFEFVEGEGLILSLKGVAVSSGSACTSDSLESSYVLRAMGIPDWLAHCSIRFGLGKSNTEEQIDYVIGLLVKNVARLRAMSPLS